MSLNEIYLDILHAVFINKNFIKGEENCNYEKYLLELVNNSIYFRKKAGFERYEAPSSEAKEECDCNSPDYKLDFKLLESKTRFQASRELTGEIQLYCEGVIGAGPPRRQNTEMRVTRLYSAIRGLSCEELRGYLGNKYKYGTIESDIKSYVKVLTTKKNLFFLFPYQFWFEKHYDFKFVIENINIALAKDFKESNLFRKKYCGEYDTFWSYIYEDNLIVSKFESDSKLQIVDTIYLFKSKTYEKLYNYVNY